MMSENEQTSAVSPPVPAPVCKKKRSIFRPWPLIAVLAIALAGWQWFATQQLVDGVRQETGRQLAVANAENLEARGAQKQLREQVDTLQAKLGAIDGKLSDFQTQGAALQNLYQDVAYSREEAALIEVEQGITLAGQQLQLAGNVPLAVLALQTADARLARLDRPQHLPLRKALARDMERLSAVPVIDVPGISLRLEQIVGNADKLPLSSAARLSGKTGKAASADEPSGWWQHAGDAVWGELKGLIRIQRLDRDAPALLAPGQEYFLRENLKLRLLSARLALLAHDQATFRDETRASLELLQQHFDGNDKTVQAAQAILRPMLSTRLGVELPVLNDSLAALQAMRGGREKP